MSVLERLKELGVELPQSAPPAAAYVPCVKANGFLFTAGQTPRLNGALQYTGKADTMPIEEAQKAARMCAINCLSVIEHNGGLDNVEHIVKVTGFVNCGLDFTKQAQVIDGASKFLVEVFGEKGAHARSAVGMASLPGGATCEVEMIVKMKE